MKLGYHAPLPPAPTGVADYAQALLAALSPYFDVEVNAGRADLHLYQAGNNALHRTIIERAVREPGAVLLHDASLHHFYLGALSHEAYVHEFCAQYGEWRRGFAERLWDARGRSAADERYFQYPMLRPVVERARLVLVHNRAAAEIARRHGAPRIEEIPHLHAAPAPGPDHEVIALRARLGLTGARYLFAVFGHLRETKRVTAILRSFRRARRRQGNIALLVAGRFASADLERTCAPLLAGEGVLRAGYLAERDFWNHARAADCCLNLRYPSCGETSGIAIRLMSLGKPVMVSRGEEYSAHPDGSYLPIAAGPSEEAQLEEWMVTLAREPGLGRDIGALAKRHIEREHAAGEVGRRLAAMLHQLQ
ncbi:MAG: glycosyltransferase [Bryobacterales bacterium]|nr:glycosyltransferase [Bryobacterales bacterium]